MYDAGFILRLFEERLASLGMSQADLGCEAFGKEDNSAIQGLRRGSTPAIDRVEAMANVLGLECYLGPPRKRPSGMAESDTETDFVRADAARGGYFAIPWHRPGLGPNLSPIAFEHQWMSDNALISDRLSAVQPDEFQVAGGESGKAIVIIDTAAIRRASHDLWCYTEKNRTIVARATFDANDIILTSDLPTSPPRLIRQADLGAITFLGRVVWVSFRPHH